MAACKERESSGSELVFSVLRTLMIAYQLWGIKSGVMRSTLGKSVRASDTDVDVILGYLECEGLVNLDAYAGTARLSTLGVHKLFGTAQ